MKYGASIQAVTEVDMSQPSSLTARSPAPRPRTRVPGGAGVRGVRLLLLCPQSGLTPVHVAAFMGHLNIVLLLLQNGTCPDATNIVSMSGAAVRLCSPSGERARDDVVQGDCGTLPARGWEGGGPGGFPQAVAGLTRSGLPPWPRGLQ